MNRLYATLLVLAEVLWSYSVIVALTEWAWIGWERPPLSLPVAMLLAAAALVPVLLSEGGSLGIRAASRLRAPDSGAPARVRGATRSVPWLRLTRP